MQYVFEIWSWQISLEKCISIANAVEAPVALSRLIKGSSDTPPTKSKAPVRNIAAGNKRTTQPKKDWNCKGVVCGLEEHPRNKCQAQQSTCLKCGQQWHGAAEWKSTLATIASDDDEQISFELCSVRTTNEVTKFLNGVFKNIFTGEDCSLPYRTLIDPGSTRL